MLANLATGCCWRCAFALAITVFMYSSVRTKVQKQIIELVLRCFFFSSSCFLFFWCCFLLFIRLWGKIWFQCLHTQCKRARTLRIYIQAAFTVCRAFFLIKFSFERVVCVCALEFIFECTLHTKLGSVIHTPEHTRQTHTHTPHARTQ